MRFFQIVASGAAFIAAALALEINQFPAGGVKAGQTYTITYSPASDTPTTFILRKGLSTDLDTVGTLTSMSSLPAHSSSHDPILTIPQPLPLVVLTPGPSLRTSSTAPTTPLRSSRRARPPTTRPSLA
jgi:hypothetical protein